MCDARGHFILQTQCRGLERLRSHTTHMFHVRHVYHEVCIVGGCNHVEDVDVMYLGRQGCQVNVTLPRCLSLKSCSSSPMMATVASNVLFLQHNVTGRCYSLYLWFGKSLPRFFLIPMLDALLTIKTQCH